MEGHAAHGATGHGRPRAGVSKPMRHVVDRAVMPTKNSTKSAWAAGAAATVTATAAQRPIDTITQHRSSPRPGANDT